MTGTKIKGHCGFSFPVKKRDTYFQQCQSFIWYIKQMLVKGTLRLTKTDQF